MAHWTPPWERPDSLRQFNAVDVRITERIKDAIGEHAVSLLWVQLDRLDLQLTARTVAENPFERGRRRCEYARELLSYLPTLSTIQQKVYRAFFNACLPHIYGKAYFQRYRHDILTHHRIAKLQQECLITAPRREGKSMVSAIVLAIMLMICKDVRIAIFASGLRASMMLLKMVEDFLLMLPECNLVGRNKLCLVHSPEIGDERVLNSYPCTTGVRRSARWCLFLLHCLCDIQLLFCLFVCCVCVCVCRCLRGSTIAKPRRQHSGARAHTHTPPLTKPGSCTHTSAPASQLSAHNNTLVCMQQQRAQNTYRRANSHTPAIQPSAAVQPLRAHSGNVCRSGSVPPARNSHTTLFCTSMASPWPLWRSLRQPAPLFVRAEIGMRRPACTRP